jgi:hypothetical protein
VGANGEVNAEYFCVLHALADTSLMPSRLTVPMGRWNKGGVDGRTREARIIVGVAAGRERARAGLQNPINCTGGRTTSPVTRLASEMVWRILGRIKRRLALFCILQ